MSPAFKLIPSKENGLLRTGLEKSEFFSPIFNEPLPPPVCVQDISAFEYRVERASAGADMAI